MAAASLAKRTLGQDLLLPALHAIVLRPHDLILTAAGQRPSSEEHQNAGCT